MVFYSFNFRENGIYTNPNVDKHLPHLSLERYLNEYTEVYRDEFAGFELQNKSIIHIVCETFFHKFNELNEEQYQRFFTEKTFKSIMACQPFILGSNSKDLERLRSFGFKTFSDWWDESYDIMPDKERMEAIQSLIYEINKWDYDKIKTVYNEMIPILIHNYENVKTLDDRFKEFQNNTIYTVMEGYEYPLSYYDFQEENIVDNSWKILT